MSAQAVPLREASEKMNWPDLISKHNSDRIEVVLHVRTRVENKRCSYKLGASAVLQ